MARFLIKTRCNLTSVVILYFAVKDWFILYLYISLLLVLL